MADSHHPRPDSPERGWTGVFAALPLETPPADGWARVSSVLAAQRVWAQSRSRDRRRYWIGGMAAAALLAVFIVGPLDRYSVPPTNESAHTDAIMTTAASTNSVKAAADAARTTNPIAAAPHLATTDSGPAARVDETRALRPVDRGPVDRARARQATDRLIASLPGTATMMLASQPSPAVEPSPADPSSPTLQERSARLEALVALLRDDRVGTGSTSLLTGALEADIARIDAALADDGLSPSGRNALWRQRVDTLEQLAGMESTGRWLAAHGSTYDAALVRVD